MSFNKVVRLRVQVTEKGLTFIAAPRKGEEGEEDALEAIQHIKTELSKCGVHMRTFERKTQNGRRTDMISTF